MLDRLVRHDMTPPSRSAYLYAVPADGAAELDRALRRRSIRRRADEPFEPHITLGLFSHAAEAEQVARIVERQHLPMHGRVEELALLRRDGDRLDTLASVRLGGMKRFCDPARRRQVLLVVVALRGSASPVAWAEAALIIWDVAAGGGPTLWQDVTARRANSRCTGRMARAISIGRQERRAPRWSWCRARRCSGRDEPRLKALARTFARAGFACWCPSCPKCAG